MRRHDEPDEYPKPMAYRDCDACGGVRNAHPTVHVEAGGQAACVDVLVAPLIEECWLAGIGTDESCQDANEADGLEPYGVAWIFFESPVDLMRFAELVVTEPLDDLVDAATDGAWEWSVRPTNGAADWEREIELGWMSMVAIPHQDLDATVNRLRKQRGSHAS